MNNELNRIENSNKFYNDIKKDILKRHNEELEYINSFINVLPKTIISDVDPLDLKAIKLYIQSRNFEKVADILNNEGFRIEGVYGNGNKRERKYNSNDVRELIFSEENININTLNDDKRELIKMANLIYSMNCKGILAKNKWKVIK